MKIFLGKKHLLGKMALVKLSSQMMFFLFQGSMPIS